jgi:hypothetical protein
VLYENRNRTNRQNQIKYVFVLGLPLLNNRTEKHDTFVKHALLKMPKSTNSVCLFLFSSKSRAIRERHEKRILYILSCTSDSHNRCARFEYLTKTPFRSRRDCPNKNLTNFLYYVSNTFSYYPIVWPWSVYTSQ